MAGGKRKLLEADGSKKAVADLNFPKTMRLQPLESTDSMQDPSVPAATADDSSLLHDTVGAVFVDAAGAGLTCVNSLCPCIRLWYLQCSFTACQHAAGLHRHS